MPDTECGRGRLISVEGLSGVGKTYLTNRLLARHPGGQITLLEEFSQRPHTPDTRDLGRDLLNALIAAAHGDPFLRGGHPGTETLLLLAIKMFDYEAGCVQALAAGRTVIEGRSVHSTAVYQSLIIHSDDEPAYRQARTILDLAAAWRPLPDLTILITDDVATCLHRAQTRDHTRYTPEHWRLHQRAAALFARLADDDPQRVVILDRRDLPGDIVVDQMQHLIQATPVHCPAPPTGQSDASAACAYQCHRQPTAA